MPKIISDCDEFHLVEEDEICATIANDYGITLDDFLKWNPVVGEKCDGLWKDAYVCVGVTVLSNFCLTNQSDLVLSDSFVT